MKKLVYLYIVLTACISCDDYLDIKPVGQVIPSSVEDYRSFLTSAYSIKNLDKILTTYRGDELQLNPDSPGVEQYTDIYIWNDENPSPLRRSFPYASFYSIIFYCNHIIESKNEITGDSGAIDELVGEAYALRAMQYFRLVNLYAKPYERTTADQDPAIPIVTKYQTDVDYPVNSVQEVYDLILNDLNRAEDLIGVAKQEVGLNYRFSKVAVKAFQTRVYLYQNEWQKAIDHANAALSLHSELQDLNADVSHMPSEYNSVESILALETVASFDTANNTTIADDLIGIYDQSTDLRFDLYFRPISGGGFRSKKNADTKFKVSYRTSELYLIKAEALARLGQTEAATDPLLELAKHRYTPEGFLTYQQNTEVLNDEELLSAILEERRKEFAIEGHRWFDLRRTTQAKITKTYDGQLYTLEKNDLRYVIPIPNDAIINNPDL
ncbi:SusD-like starch-binding protein associating with outer membrane [Leeuwenhoekiella aestuarii]|uniref:SusD-like starch-binding protein associating with outer membrane n=1 Tax=Leeuwenhoekiella aestuarii TaxID=2249426 RepID=A0A4Q0NWL1_9FLAO|nr:RagB/SusD family nutrient uptake outer membrane protein [Leeuwenhoekiella aestuarii]RXG11629.1 SusD-like starch-binding protein associating with outer membrane [Leeuwenhoekiella aestuarii]RXG15160.1 SusD-like starch-binding protein associating with outer membrane [Leeuwenhoekiella aestuarii]